MIHFLTLKSIQRITITLCIVLTLLALPLAGAVHCADAHGDEHARVPAAEACCVVWCLSVIAGLFVIQLKWASIIQGALDLKPVRLSYCPQRWVPPPRPIDLLR